MDVERIRRAYLDHHLTTSEAANAIVREQTLPSTANLLVKCWGEVAALLHVCDDYHKQITDQLSKPQRNPAALLREHIEHPDTAPRFCTYCGRETTADQLSKRSVCIDCRIGIQHQTTWQLIHREGPYYERWRAGLLRYAYTLEDESILEAKAIDAARSLLADYVDEKPACYGECDDCNAVGCQYKPKDPDN